MPCYHPIPAYQNASRVQLHKPLPDSTALALPCGSCVGCRTTRAQHWALRCQMEAQEHEYTSVTTLTYDDDNLPPTLSKRDFQLWMKRLRKEHSNKLRYYACGEYGEQYGRPHYHAILFGVSSDTPSIANAWTQGLTYTDNVSVRAINYVCGYTTKKIGWPKAEQLDRVDKATGEILYTWQPPFQLMSRGGRQGYGIGAEAKKHYHSWAIYAINDGAKLSIPRYYKEAYKDKATKTEQEETEYRKYKHALSRYKANTTTEEYKRQLEIQEKVHYARQKLSQALRKYE